MNSVNLSGAIKEHKTHSQKKNSGKDKKIKAQTVTDRKTEGGK